MPPPSAGRSVALARLRLEAHPAIAIRAHPIDGLHLRFGMDRLRRHGCSRIAIRRLHPLLLLCQQEPRPREAFALRPEGIIRARRSGDHRLQAGAISSPGNKRRGGGRGRDGGFSYRRGSRLLDDRGRRRGEDLVLRFHTTAAATNGCRPADSGEQQCATAQSPEQRFAWTSIGSTRFPHLSRCSGSRCSFARRRHRSNGSLTLRSRRYWLRLRPLHRSRSFSARSGPYRRSRRARTRPVSG